MNYRVIDRETYYRKGVFRHSSYDSLNIELPDGYLFFAPIVNWGRYREEGGRLVMPVTVRLNHAIADGYLVANVFTPSGAGDRGVCQTVTAERCW